MITLLWLFECLIAIPSFVGGFVFESVAMGFGSGRQLGKYVFQYKTHSSLQKKVDLANTALSKARGEK